MVDYKDIRVFTRESRHGAMKFDVTVWAKAGKFVVQEIHVEGSQPIKFEDGDKFDSVDDAFFSGFERARKLIVE
jgi:hypothetical protein